MFLTSFFVAAMYHHTVLEAASITAIAARRSKVSHNSSAEHIPVVTVQMCPRGHAATSSCKTISPRWQCAAAAMVIRLRCTGTGDMQHVFTYKMCCLYVQFSTQYIMHLLADLCWVRAKKKRKFWYQSGVKSKSSSFLIFNNILLHTMPSTIEK